MIWKLKEEFQVEETFIFLSFYTDPQHISLVLNNLDSIGGQQPQYMPGGPQQGYYPPNQPLPSYNQQPPYGAPGMVPPGYPPPMGSVNPASGEGQPMPQGYAPYGGQPGMAPGSVNPASGEGLPMPQGYAPYGGLPGMAPGSVNPASGEGLPMPQGYAPYGGQPGMAPGYPPVMQQPLPQQMVPEGCPPGLQYLTMVDQLIVKQQVEMLEAFTGKNDFEPTKIHSI